MLAALKRSANELSSYQKKIFKVDDHIGIAISGLTADARSLAKCVLRFESLCDKGLGWAWPLGVNLIDGSDQSSNGASLTYPRMPSPKQFISQPRYMRTEALNHKYVYGSALQTSRLVVDVADKHQRCTQSYVRRPYGVGLLVRSVVAW